MNIWQTVTWDVARAGGFTAFGLLTLAVAIGLALTSHIQSPRWPRIINSELHNFITLLALIFTGVHVLTLVLYALVVIHGITTGSDTRTEWGAAIYAISVLLIGTLLIVRLMKPATKQNRAHPVLAVVVVVIVAIATFLCMLGPFQQGWSSIASNGNSSGGQTTIHVAPSQHIVSPRPAFPQSSPEDLQDN